MPKVQELPLKYKLWLTEEAVYIITEKEKEVFLQLETDRDRNLFIEAFWNQRDPNPMTLENEFKHEHYRRIRYANETFGKGTSKPGWKTDRGRVFVILGKPVTTSSFGAESLNLVPIELWFYQGEYGFGLPSAFYVVFFQEEGIGDYILYSPLRHGPKKLFESYDGDPNQAAKILMRFDRELAGVSLSLIPGARSVYDPKLALESDMLLNKISGLPQKKVNDLYAEKLLMYKSLIEVDHSVNYVPSDCLLKIIKENDGRHFVHYAVEPGRLSIGSGEGKYFARLEIFGRVSNLQEKTVYQFQKDMTLNFSPDEVAEMKTKRFSFQDAFPLIEGHFKFSVLVKNPISKEFSTFEDEVDIPKSSSLPELSPLLLSQTLDEDIAPASKFRPFRLGNIQSYPTASKAFTKSNRLIVGFKIDPLPQDLRDTGTLDFSFFREDKEVHFFSKAVRDFESLENCLEHVSLDNFDPGQYLVVVTLRDQDKKEISASREDFTVTTRLSLPAVWSVSEVLPALDDPYYSYILGTQLLNNDQIKEARSLLEDAVRKNPSSLEFSLGLGQALFRSNEYQKVQDVLVRFLEKANDQVQVYDLLGKSAYLLNEFGRAIYYFKKSLSHFGTNLEVLNMLAESYYQTGSLDEARSAWKKSLEMAPDQEEIIKKLEKLAPK